MLSLSADRSDEGVAGEPSSSQSHVGALEGYEGDLDPSSAERWVPAAYDAYLTGPGRSRETGVRQRLRVIVLEREGRTTWSPVTRRTRGRRRGTKDDGAQVAALAPQPVAVSAADRISRSGRDRSG